MGSLFRKKIIVAAIVLLSVVSQWIYAESTVAKDSTSPKIMEPLIDGFIQSIHRLLLHRESNKN